MPIYEVALVLTKEEEVNDTIDALDECDAVESVKEWYKDKYPGFTVSHWSVEKLDY